MATSPPNLRGTGTGTSVQVAAKALAQVVFGRPSLYGIPAAIPNLALGETRYHAPTSPARCTGFSASLLRRTFIAAAREAAVRRENAAHWKASLPAILSEGIPPVLAGATAGYLRFPLRLPKETTQRVGRGEETRMGIARSYPMPLGDLPAVAERLIDSTRPCPGARALSQELVTLPTHSGLTHHDRTRLIALAAAWR